jgi:hypothetical protein
MLDIRFVRASPDAIRQISKNAMTLKNSHGLTNCSKKMPVRVNSKARPMCFASDATPLPARSMQHEKPVRTQLP